MDPAFHSQAIYQVSHSVAGQESLDSPEMSVTVVEGPDTVVQVKDAKGRTMITVSNLFSQPRAGGLAMVHDENEDLYGMRGLDRADTGAGILRNGGTIVHVKTSAPVDSSPGAANLGNMT